MTLRLAIVDDHLLFREALSLVLSQDEALDVVGEASDARAAVALVEAKRPDVVLVDALLPGVDGFEVAKTLHERLRTKVLILSTEPEAVCQRAMDCGASGCVGTNAGYDRLLEAVHAVCRGERVFPLESARVSGTMRRDPAGSALSPLSARERQIFDLIVQGRSNKDISRDLCVSVKTVETHRANINRKLGVHSPGQLVRFAASRGLVRSLEP
jgi:two-component system, NarL family, response regulator NreC